MLESVLTQTPTFYFTDQVTHAQISSQASKTNNGATLDFESQLWAAADKLRGHDQESRTLASLRDNLLPKLMRGEVSVKERYTKIMSTLSADTHPKMEALQIRLLRQASPTRKMHMLAQLNAFVRLVALAGLRSRHPQATETEIRRRLADLLLGEVLARKVYGESGHAK